MSSAPHQQKHDKRLFERYISRGELSRSDFESHLDKLPDLEAQADSITHLVLGSEAAAADDASGSEA